MAQHLLYLLATCAFAQTGDFIVIDINAEKIVSFGKAARTPPCNVHISTLHRWRLKGINGIKLESVLIGGRRMTSLEAVERFVHGVTAAANGERPPARTPRQRERAIERAEAELGRRQGEIVETTSSEAKLTN